MLSVLPKLAATTNEFQGLPNISTHANSNWAISADFLAWYASEEVASIWADVVTIGNNTSSWGAPSFKFKWDYGFRVGIGYDLEYGQWDSAISWTWFHTDATHTIPFQPNNTLGPEFFAGFLSGNTPQSMKSQWSLVLNMFDWELGRDYLISKSLSLRPFLGLKGGWIDQSILAHYYNLTIDSVPTTNTGSEHLKNYFWGIGPLGGVNTKWRMRNFGSQFIDLFGDFSLASLWGTWNCGDKYKNTVHQTSSVNTKNASLGALMLRGFIGIGWDANLFNGRSHLAAKLGFETQLWVNQLRIATFQLQRLHNDLSLQGITCNCRFDF